MGERSVIGGFTILSAFILFSIIAVPLVYPHGTFVNLDGTSSIIDRDWSGYGIGGAIYWLGDLLCHQEMARCFIINGSQTAFCMRDVALLTGFLLCLPFSLRIIERLSDRKTVALSLILIALTFAEWTIEKLFFESAELRVILGVLSGIGIALMLSWLIRKAFRSED